MSRSDDKPEDEEITVSVRLPKGEYDRLKEIAETEHRSLGQQARVMILKQMEVPA